MSDPHPEPGPDLSPDLPTSDDPLFRDYLLALLDVGAAVAQGIKHQAKRQSEDDAPTPSIDTAEQFERVSRAMRRNILLARHIAQRPAQSQTQSQHRTQARKRIIRDVEDAIQRAPRNNEALRAEFLDRLDSPDLEEEIASRPVADVILDIRRDLGLENWLGNHPWERRTPRDIEALRQRAAALAPPNYLPAEHPPDIARPLNRRPHPPDPDLRTTVKTHQANARAPFGTGS